MSHLKHINKSYVQNIWLLECFLKFFQFSNIQRFILSANIIITRHEHKLSLEQRKLRETKWIYAAFRIKRIISETAFHNLGCAITLKKHWAITIYTRCNNYTKQVHIIQNTFPMPLVIFHKQIIYICKYVSIILNCSVYLSVSWNCYLRHSLSTQRELHHILKRWMFFMNYSFLKSIN